LINLILDLTRYLCCDGNMRALAIFVLLLQTTLQSSKDTTPVAVFFMSGEMLTKDSPDRLPKPGLFRSGDGRHMVLVGYAPAESRGNSLFSEPDPAVCDTWHAVLEKPNGDNVRGFYLVERDHGISFNTVMSNRYYIDLLNEEPPFRPIRNLSEVRVFAPGDPLPSDWPSSSVLVGIHYNKSVQNPALFQSRQLLQAGNFSMAEFLETYLMGNLKAQEVPRECVHIRCPVDIRGGCCAITLELSPCNIYFFNCWKAAGREELYTHYTLFRLLEQMVSERLDKVSCELLETRLTYIIRIRPAGPLGKCTREISEALGDFFVHLILTSELQQGKSVPVLPSIK